MRITIETELVNVGSRFHRAIWRERRVGYTFNTAREARAAGYNLANCNYYYKDADGNEIRRYNNAKLDGYGRRYR